MLLTFIRSSMLTTEAICSHKFALEYNFNRKSPPNRSAIIGSTIHAVLECGALEKLAQQNNQPKFKQEQLGEEITGNYDYFSYLNRIYSVIDKEYPGVFNDESYKDCLKLLNKALAYKNGEMNPKNCDIISSEIPFDITIPDDWATYNFVVPAGKLSGQLQLKGTIDLVIKYNEDTYIIRDYKTGSKNNWATGREKKYKDLFDDIQLRLYHYAACQLYPDIQNILFSLYYIKSDTVFDIVLSREDLKETETILRKKYQKIVNDNKPLLRDTNGRYQDFRCRFCPFAKSREVNGQTTCAYFRDQITLNGYEKTMAAFGDFEALQKYGAGGSARNRE